SSGTVVVSAIGRVYPGSDPAAFESCSAFAPPALTSPTPPLPRGEEGIKKKLSWSFSPLSLGERGVGGVRGPAARSERPKILPGEDVQGAFGPLLCVHRSHLLAWRSPS